MMVWHIFRKDLRLSWKFALVTAMLQWCATGLVRASTLPNYSAIAALRPVVKDAGVLAFFLVIVTLVHRDAVPGSTHDWLIRPIRRKDMMLAKLLFYVLAIQLPILIGWTAEGIVFGLGFGDSFLGALWQSAMLTIGIGVPALAISAITANIVEAAVATAVAVMAVIVMMTAGSWGGGLDFGAIRTEWIEEVSLSIGMFFAGTIALVIQYRRRSTIRARVASGIVLVLGAAGSLMPLNAALAFERKIAPVPGAGQNVRLAFDSSAARYGAPGARSGSQLPPIYLPIRAEGLAPGMEIVLDRAEVQVTGPYGGVQKYPRVASPAFASGHGYQSLEGLDFSPWLRDGLVHVHADYWLTMVKETGNYTMPEANGDAQIPPLGKCRTVWADFGVADFSCVKAGPVTGCYAIVPERAQNSVAPRCMTYAPPYVWLPNWDEIVTTQDRFLLANGGDANVSVRIYRAIDHFQRSLDISNVRLRDWEAVAPK
jgi:hypothetical protein